MTRLFPHVVVTHEKAALMGVQFVPIVDYLVRTKLADTKSAARRLIDQKGARIQDIVITDPKAAICLVPDDISEENPTGRLLIIAMDGADNG